MDLPIIFNNKQTKLRNLFFRDDVLSKKQFKDLTRESRKNNQFLSETILDNVAQKDEDRALLIMSEFFDMPVVLLRNKNIAPLVINLIPKEIAEQHRVLVFKKTGERVSVATTTPENKQILKFVEKKTGLGVDIYITTPKDIDYALKKYTGKLGFKIKQKKKNIDYNNQPKTSASDNSQLVDSLDEMTQYFSTTKLINNIIERAIELNASDIHIESGYKKVFVRYRIDGILNKINEFPKKISPAVVSRIRILANLKIDEHMAPQDGRFHYKYNNKNTALRVSIIPTLHGPKIVLRVLEMKEKTFSLSKLGLNAVHHELAKNELSLSQGMILVTGPTGSGKTTTLYTILSQLNNEGVNISTIEDPIEYGIDQINQTQIRPNLGLTFASGLKSLLRQDPDVIMVGEIRDTETAEIAANSALTGHLVLSTLHTNNAFLAPQRLIEMGIQQYMANSVLKFVIGQRLVRRLCRNCRQKINFSNNIAEKFGLGFDIKATIKKLIRLELLPKITKLSDFEIYEAGKCSRCAHTGYRGRVGIYEIMKLDNELRNYMTKDCSENGIKKYLTKKDTITMAEDGLLKVFLGITTPEEVARVTKE